MQMRYLKCQSAAGLEKYNWEGLEWYLVQDHPVSDGLYLLEKSHFHSDPPCRQSFLALPLSLGQPELSGHTLVPANAWHVPEPTGGIANFLPTGQVGSGFSGNCRHWKNTCLSITKCSPRLA